MNWLVGNLPWRRVGNWMRENRMAGGLRAGRKTELRELRCGEVCGVDGLAGDLVRCESGVMWVTMVGGGDVILRAGESFIVGVRGRVVVEALRAGVLGFGRGRGIRG